MLQQIADEFIQTGCAPLRGQVFGPRGPLIPGSELAALYAAIPVYFPDDFAAHQSAEWTTVFVWLVPISASEAKCVSADRHGESSVAEACDQAAVSALFRRVLEHCFDCGVQVPVTAMCVIGFDEKLASAVDGADHSAFPNSDS